MKFLFSFLILLTLNVILNDNQNIEYVCTPCDLSCDEITFNKPGLCPHCNMELVKKSDLKTEKLELNKINIQEGSGKFLIDDGSENKGRTITVYYHKPKNYSPESKIIIVIPGAGRNANSYRDAWVEKSEKYSILILSPMYKETEYKIEDYHFCGLIKESNLIQNVEYIENTNISRLDEEKFNFEFNANSNEWIFDDFDRIFKLAKETLSSTEPTYDIFGHSAGGHILHRFALFQENSNVDKILSSNPSFYTLPSYDYHFPFGLKDLPIEKALLENAFKKNLVVFLGEEDNENETGGTFLRSKSADKQGIHRLARGKYFFKKSKEIADELGYEFNWQLVTIPNVGHNHQLMGDAAGKYLYERN